MTALTYSVRIDGPLERVWDHLTDPEKIKGWMHGVEENTLLSEGEPRAGAIFEMKIREGKKLSTYQGEFLAYEAPRRLSIKMTGGCRPNSPPMFVDYDLTEEGPGTRLDYACRMEARGFWVLLTPLFKIMGRMFVKKFFRTLKQMVESPTPAMA